MLPVLLLILVRAELPLQLGLALILLSKWRMFAVKPRYWLANIRANAVDLIAGISFLLFMSNSHLFTSTDAVGAWQVIWAAAYGVWLIFIKPGAGVLYVSLQAAIAQATGLMALFLVWSDAPIFALVGMSWFICYASARHFFTSFDESLTNFLSYVWGYFAAALVWILSHWLLFYGIIAQPTLLLSVLGFGMAALYYLEKNDKLSVLVRRNFIFVMVAIVAIVVALSDWGDKTV